MKQRRRRRKRDLERKVAALRASAGLPLGSNARTSGRPTERLRKQLPGSFEGGKR